MFLVGFLLKSSGFLRGCASLNGKPDTWRRLVGRKGPRSPEDGALLRWWGYGCRSDEVHREAELPNISLLSRGIRGASRPRVDAGCDAQKAEAPRQLPGGSGSCGFAPHPGLVP